MHRWCNELKEECRTSRLEAYRFIEQHNRDFGIRWRLRRLGICQNAYYNYRKHRKADYYAGKEAAKALIREIICSIADLYDQSVIASVTDRQITSSLAIRTLRKALEAQPQIREELILHSDQGSQYTSKAFVEFYESVHVSQSMSKAGCPYDNAPMERYFNTLKNECVKLYDFQTEEALYQVVEEFAYVTYNHIRSHSYKGYRTPYQARTAL